MTEQVGFVDEEGNVIRDSTGHTVCSKCGMMLNRKVEKYSLWKFKKLLCFGCQRKEGDKND